MKIFKSPKLKSMPLWKWLVIIFMIIALPLFFLFVGDSQMQQVLINTTPLPSQN